MNSIAHFRGIVRFAGLALALGAATAPAHATDFKQAGPVVTVTADGGKVEVAGASLDVTGSASSVRAAGALVNLNVTTTGDLDAAGAQVNVSGSTGGKLNVVGGVLDVSGTVAGDANVGGAVVKLNVQSAGSVHVGGASVTIAGTNTVAGRLEAYGANLVIGGHVTGPVKAGGAVVTFDGIADASVEIAASKVILGPNARITGDLLVRSLNPPELQTGSVVSGSVTQEQPQTWWAVAPWQWVAGVALAVAAGTILTGLVLMLFGGHVFTTATEHVRHRPLSSFLFGILTLVLVAFVGIVLVFTAIGISVGAAILLVLPFLVVFGHSVAAAGIASAVLVRRPGEIGVPTAIFMLVIGAIVLVALTLIPWVGPIIGLIALILGTGAFTRTVGGRLRRAEPRPIV
jgi:hypothetical protein